MPNNSHGERVRAAATWTAVTAIYGGAQAVSASAAERMRGSGTRQQYQAELNRPAFAPPGVVFPVVWSALNVVTATSAWRVLRADASHPRRAALGWWSAAVAVRSGYVPLAFGRRWLWLATADSALLNAVMTVYALHARKTDSGAAALALPEIAWTAFATVLSAATARQNT